MSNHQKRSYYPALDGLRGLSCLIIVVYHDFPFIHSYIFFGWTALDIFFVLSGFLITDILLKTLGEKSYLKNFYARRILRVFPLYYTSLILYFLILPQIKGLPIQLDYFVTNQAWFWFDLQNWLLIFYPPHNQYALNHLWSLAVEEQFYLLWPLLVALVRKPKILLAIIMMVLMGVVVLRFFLWVGQIEGLAYYNLFTFTRIDGICIGCMVALMQKINPGFIGKYMALIVLSFAGINFLFYWINLNNQNNYPYLALVGFSTFSMIFGILIYDLINRKTPVFEKILDIPLLRLMGRISFGTYIFHWPLYLIISPALIRFFSSYTSFTLAQYSASIIATILAFCIGFISYRYFELHFLKMKKKFA